MNTDARRKASAAYHAKRTEEGLRKVTLWLSPEARFKLDALKKAAGSKDKAADAAILAWMGPDAVSPYPNVELAQKLALGETVGQKIIAAGGRDRLGVQIGPVHAKPGERAKKPGKGK